METSREAKIIFSVSELKSSLIRACGVKKNSNLVVAFSGGIDSHVLLHSLNKLIRDFNWQLTAVHINHGLSEQAFEWEKHCQQVCVDLSLPIVIERINIKKTSGHAGIEGEARKLRYQALARHIKKNDYLLTAHHGDDQAETMLLHLFRGTGIQGLAAMSVRQNFSTGYHIRPMLPFTRSSLEEYAEMEELNWVVDHSNLDTRFSRNYLRHTILPAIRSRWPQVDMALNRTASHTRESINLLEQVASVDLRGSRSLDDETLDTSVLQKLPPARLSNMLRYWIRQQGISAPSTKKLNEISKSIYTLTRTRQAIISWGDAEILRYRNKLAIRLRRMGPTPDLRLTWDLEHPIILPGTRQLLQAVPVIGKGLSRERTKNAGVVVRFRQGGEQCQLAGRDHHSRVKKLLQAAGIPPWERATMPLVYIDEKIAAIGTRWVCEPFAAKGDEPGLQLELLRPPELR